MTDERRGAGAAVVEDAGVVIVENSVGGPEDRLGHNLKRESDAGRQNTPFGGNDPVLVSAVALEQKAPECVREHHRLLPRNERHSLSPCFRGIEARFPAQAQVQGQLPGQPEVVLHVQRKGVRVQILAPGRLLLPGIQLAEEELRKGVSGVRFSGIAQDQSTERRGSAGQKIGALVEQVTLEVESEFQALLPGGVAEIIGELVSVLMISITET